ncbi:DUF6515 family protein [Winogradskyella endarachnes]|uniref:Orphan protein n=1 Tax=Winogradskyella endarachnes TaxID=2681965 RepID=A0A6L6U4V2_9FLAO|nr:DUF6515 family protein [Winogradskyella endarachnes]MUU77153.1 hypothetical protein [Winogradskyella endarachnes]
MKTLIKIFVLPAILFMAVSTEITAQNKRSSATKKTEKTVATKKTTTLSNKRIPSARVTYKKPTRKVVSVRSIPNRKTVKHKGQTYYYANNKFYSHSRGRFIVIAPKVGFRINVLPEHYRRVRFNSHIYFNVDGTFFIEVGDEYEVVEPEIGTIVYELPDDYEKVTIDNLTYYEYGNILYEKIQVDGTRAYEVVGIIDME